MAARDGLYEMAEKIEKDESRKCLSGILTKNSFKKGGLFMKRLFIAAVMVVFAVAFLANGVFAATPRAEAKKMVDKAVAYYKANGKQKAVEAFNDPKGAFAKGELYIFMQDFQGMMLAHGANVKLVGQNLLNLKDPDGKLFVQDMIKVAQGQGSGWTEYKWTNPLTKKIEPKLTYLQRVDDYFIGCGVFK
jgi:cytochrome c